MFDLRRIKALITTSNLAISCGFSAPLLAEAVEVPECPTIQSHVKIY
jgi:hypothetical protein